jgi:hypothetical protein
VNAPLWVSELAASFWAAAGTAEPFPRSLGAVPFALPLSVLALPRLSVAGVTAWLRARDVPYACAGPDRPLRACLVARRGSGFVLVDAADPPDERRFSLAHELAHFLRHYRQPRERACARLGPAVLEVFDGDRPARPEERLHAVLANVLVGFHAHLLGRDDRRAARGAVAVAEDEADRLAYELLAPADHVLGHGDRADLPRRLCEVYGLPAGHAARYAALLAPAPPPAEGWIGRLKKCP